MHRFFLSPASISGDAVTFPHDLSRQISRVLRMSAGDVVTVLDNSGLEYSVTLSGIDSSHTEGRVTGQREGIGEPILHLTLYQAMLRPERFEWTLQKCTELGVARFVPLITRRTIRGHTGPSANRRERWLRIIREAAEQSRRSRLPQLDSPQTLEDALGSARPPALLAWEGEKSSSLKSALERRKAARAETGALSVFIGPEGGFDPAEVESARERGVETIGLGRRILRSETAAAALIAAIMHELGELGP